LRGSRVAADGAAEGEGAAAADLVAEVACVAAADSRPRWALGLHPVQRHGQAPAALGQVRAHGRAAVKSLAPARGPAGRDRESEQRAAHDRVAHDRAAAQSLEIDLAHQAREHGPAVLAVESVKAVLELAAACRVPDRERGREQEELAAISPAVVRQRVNSAISSTCPAHRPAQLARAARDGPVALQPTSCNKAAPLSGRLSARLSEARRLAQALRRSSPRTDRAAVVVKLVVAKSAQATDPRIPLQAQAALARTLAVPELPMSVALELRI
jgi:hypothetical protein